MTIEQIIARRFTDGWEARERPTERHARAGFDLRARRQEEHFFLYNRDPFEERASDYADDYASDWLCCGI